MNGYFHVYCKVDCPYCKDAVMLLQQWNRPFVVTVIDNCAAFEEGVKRETQHSTVPIVLHQDGTGSASLVGGYAELQMLYRKLTTEEITQ